MKIVITDAQTVTSGDPDLRIFEKYGELEIFQLTSYLETKERLKDADAVLLNKTVLDREILSGCPNLKYIGTFATGYNNIDTAYCRERGIRLCNAGSYSTDAVAQAVFGFLLNHACRTADYNDFVQRGGWNESPTFTAFVYPTMELAGRTMGIVGYGAIGKKTAGIARAFGMRVIVLPHDLKKALAEGQPAGIAYVDFDTLLRESDVISCHCPLNAESREMFNAEAFGKMKQGAYFINTARGGLVVEEALKEALESGHLSGAGVDVIGAEPMREDCILKGVRNLTITPHVGWTPYETRVRVVEIARNCLEKWLAGTPVNVIC